MTRPGFKLEEEIRSGQCRIRHFQSGRLVRAEEMGRMETERPLLHLKLALLLAALGEHAEGQMLRQELLRQFEQGPLAERYEMEYGQGRWIL